MFIIFRGHQIEPSPSRDVTNCVSMLVTFTTAGPGVFKKELSRAGFAARHGMRGDVWDAKTYSVRDGRVAQKAGLRIKQKSLPQLFYTNHSSGWSALMRGSQKPLRPF